MTVRITKQDIEEAGRDGTRNPITRAIQRAVGGRWFVYAPLACEMTEPHRAITLPVEVCAHWERFQDTGSMEPLEFDLALPPGLQKEGLP